MQILKICDKNRERKNTMEITKERLEGIIHELINELACGAEDDYFEETMDNIFTEDERKYFEV